MAAVSLPVSSPYPSLDNQHSSNSMHTATESPAAQRKNRAPRQRLPAEVQSDSNVAAQTPKAKKSRPRQSDNKAMSGSEAPYPRTASKAQRSKQMPVARDTPALLATPAKNLAYASAAFHQSPAASSLPMPKFLSKSVPAQPRDNTLQSRLDHEAEKSSASPSPPAAVTPDPLAREKSPLDMFFNADRQEKAKHQSFGSLINGHNSPCLPDRSPLGVSKDLFAIDMEGSESPAARRSLRPSHGPRMASAPGNLPVDDQTNPTAAATQSLKAFLKLPAMQPPQQQTSPRQQQPFVNASPVAQPHFQHNPFIASTPQQHRASSGSDPSLHYGNRNLSPLFQAARTPNGGQPPANDSPLHGKTPIRQSQPFDPRAFIDQQARSTASANHAAFSPAREQRTPNAYNAAPRQLSNNHDMLPESPSSRFQPRSEARASYHDFAAQRQPPHGSTESADIDDMSAKLRGMLKLGF